MYEAKFKISLTKQATAEIEQKVKEISKRFEQKGRLTNSSHANDNLTLVVEGDGRATDFLVPFEKQLREELGKEFKIGTKKVVVETYVVSDELEEEAKTKIKIPFAKVDLNGKIVTLAYEDLPFEWVKDHYVEKSFKLIKDKIKMQNYEGKDEYREYVWKGKERPFITDVDPAVELEEKGWIKRTEAKGQFVYGREFTALMNVVKDLFADHVFTPLGFFEATFPKFETWNIPKASGHAKNIYPNAYFVSVPKNASAEYWEEVTDLYAITGEIPIEQVIDRSSCVGMLSYAQCPPFWPYLKNKIIDEQTLPLLVYDWSGPTYRNESGGTHGLDRIEEFHRTEILFVGTQEQVVKAWEDVKEHLRKLFDEVMDIEIQIAKVTPWWMAHVGMRTASENPNVGTYDFDAYLPYRGDRTKEWLEIQNDSSNGDKYPKAFYVKGKNNEYLWSGCAGHSIERIITAFLAQKGTDTKSWPKEVKERFEKKIQGIKPLKFY